MGERDFECMTIAIKRLSTNLLLSIGYIIALSHIAMDLHGEDSKTGFSIGI